MLLNQNIIAIVCDCDDTLTPDTTNYLLNANGIDIKKFWQDNVRLVKDGWDPPIAWMTAILDMMDSGEIAQNTNEALRKFGGTIITNNGILEFIPHIESLVANNKEFNNANISIEFYIISSGFEEIINGAPFAKYFRDIFGGTYAENSQTGKINAIKSCITFTEKTKFLYAINKGITGVTLREDPFQVNQKIALDDRRIPFRNMIYIGDSRSDIPCFSAVNQNGGQCVGIAGDSTFQTGHKLAQDKRMTVGPYIGNYETGSDLRSAVEACIRDIGYKIVGK